MRKVSTHTRWSVGNTIALRCIWYEIMSVYMGSPLYQMYVDYVCAWWLRCKEETRKGIPVGTCQDAACLTEYAISFYRSTEEVTCRQDL